MARLEGFIQAGIRMLKERGDGIGLMLKMETIDFQGPEEIVSAIRKNSALLEMIQTEITAGKELVVPLSGFHGLAVANAGGKCVIGKYIPEEQYFEALPW